MWAANIYINLCTQMKTVLAGLPMYAYRPERVFGYVPRYIPKHTCTHLNHCNDWGERARVYVYCVCECVVCVCVVCASAWYVCAWRMCVCVVRVCAVCVFGVWRMCGVCVCVCVLICVYLSACIAEWMHECECLHICVCVRVCIREWNQPCDIHILRLGYDWNRPCSTYVLRLSLYNGKFKTRKIH